MVSLIFLSFLVIPTNKHNNQVQLNVGEADKKFQDQILKSSNGDLSYESIFQNTSIIRRDLESIKFEVNVSAFESANRTFIEIDFPNGTIRSFEMNYSLPTIKNFTYEYKPKGYSPLGFHNVRFIVTNISEDEQLNTGTTYTNFTVTSTFWVNFNSSEYIRGDALRADIFLLETSIDYEWKALVVNSTAESQQDVLLEFTEDPTKIMFIINEDFDQLNYIYYVIINMTEDSWVTWNVDYWGFYVKNSEPVVYKNTIQFNPTSVFRGEMCNVMVSVNDSESSPSNIDVKMRLIDPNRDTAFTQTLRHSENGLFIGNFTISGSRPKGIYEVEFNATDDDGGKTSVLKKITIKNNPPEIDGFEINGIDTDKSISVNYGDELKFKFDVDDFEGLSYITVELIMEDATSDEVDEYDISREYEDDLEIIIRTEDLSAGTWTVYVSVTDTDGETTDLEDDFDTGPQQITIIPDILSNYMPWITLIIGMILGIVAGLAIGYRLRKLKYPEYKTEEEKMPAKIKPRIVKEKEIPTMPKTIEKEKKEKPEKEEPRRPTPKRKIKRKL